MTPEWVFESAKKGYALDPELFRLPTANTEEQHSKNEDDPAVVPPPSTSFSSASSPPASVSRVPATELHCHSPAIASVGTSGDAHEAASRSRASSRLSSEGRAISRELPRRTLAPANASALPPPVRNLFLHVALFSVGYLIEHKPESNDIDYFYSQFLKQCSTDTNLLLSIRNPLTLKTPATTSKTLFPQLLQIGKHTSATVNYMYVHIVDCR